MWATIPESGKISTTAESAQLCRNDWSGLKKRKRNTCSVGVSSGCIFQNTTDFKIYGLLHSHFTTWVQKVHGVFKINATPHWRPTALISAVYEQSICTELWNTTELLNLGGVFDKDTGMCVYFQKHPLYKKRPWGDDWFCRDTDFASYSSIWYHLFVAGNT